MARPIRLDYPETFYHVLSRGNDKREIFRDHHDCSRFLDMVGEMVERFKLEVHAFVLMRNHYHLLVRTKQANLSRAIQWLGVSYSTWFNRRHQRSGHLFQGRFKSFVIENEHYFLALSYYIHGNPIRAGITKQLPGYRWSSYHTYADTKHQVPWLRTDLILGLCGRSRRKYVKAQRESFEHSGSVLNDLRHGLYLGGEEFAEECLERLKGGSHRENPQYRSLLRSQDLQTLTCAVLERLGEEDPDSVLRARWRQHLNRDLAMYILYQLGVYRNEEIGKVFGIGYTAVREAVKRVQGDLGSNRQLRERVEKIEIDI